MDHGAQRLTTHKGLLGSEATQGVWSHRPLEPANAKQRGLHDSGSYMYRVNSQMFGD